MPANQNIRDILISGCRRASGRHVRVRRDHLVAAGAQALVSTDATKPDQLQRVDRLELLGLLTSEPPALPAEKKPDQKAEKKPARPADK